MGSAKMSKASAKVSKMFPILSKMSTHADFPLSGERHYSDNPDCTTAKPHKHKETALRTALDRANFRVALEFVRSMQETPEEWLLYKEMFRAGDCSDFSVPSIPAPAFEHSLEVVESRFVSQHATRQEA